MPAPRRPGESRSAFVDRCMSYMNEHHPGKSRKQQLAICYEYAARRTRGDKKKT